eukprot:TRINITY_DN67613_c9_g4_i1.p2 TRINITY_DN67613_c9_g4~~TRINITY_DN67613_c9_g4_i1.p2  ORF type:complete len:133 (-),score=3.56 TRINITY_DN67613_c9_g4_i1:120-518(-)
MAVHQQEWLTHITAHSSCCWKVEFFCTWALLLFLCLLLPARPRLFRNGRSFLATATSCLVVCFVHFQFWKSIGWGGACGRRRPNEWWGILVTKPISSSILLLDVVGYCGTAQQQLEVPFLSVSLKLLKFVVM